ncbi:protein of unknown function [Methylocaldum szegediense]|uniref:Transposase n=1 Tax=Methylocaldum szegediense TaxID=73780 RepID=A0ABN8X2T2_9GAMM|nr:protein of unknown function [Methylocaldum szegediense]
MRAGVSNNMARIRRSWRAGIKANNLGKTLSLQLHAHESSENYKRENARG